MPRRLPTTAFLLLLAAIAAPGAEILRGFQPEKHVQQPTRLDWEFAAGEDAGRLPARYDSRQTRYQLFVPGTYKPSRAYPLVFFLSPGDDPLGWRFWRKPCEDAEWLFAALYGAGNACSPAQRVRMVLDVLQDIHRQYRIDGDRTYLVGFGGSATVACRVAFHLPELFAGVVCLAGDAPVPRLAHLRRRLVDRLSVALVVGSADPGRARQEKYLAPLYRALGVRSRLWAVAGLGHELPGPGVLADVQRWLEDDLKRRQTDRRDRIGADADSHRARAALALEQAQKELRRPEGLGAGAAELEWLICRWGKTVSADRAGELLAELRRDPERSKALAEQTNGEQRAVLTAQARALEQFKRLEDARQTWERAGRLGDAEERRNAAAEVKRLAGLLARQAYLGATFAGDTTEVRSLAPGGPAERAGLRPGDRVEQVGETKVATVSEVRASLRAARPGDRLRLGLRRNGKGLSLMVQLSAPPVGD